MDPWVRRGIGITEAVKNDREIIRELLTFHGSTVQVRSSKMGTTHVRVAPINSRSGGTSQKSGSRLVKFTEAPAIPEFRPEVVRLLPSGAARVFSIGHAYLIFFRLNEI